MTDHGEDLTIVEGHKYVTATRTYIYLTLAEASQGSLNMKVFRSKWFVNCKAEAQIEFAEKDLDGNKAQKAI